MGVDKSLGPTRPARDLSCPLPLVLLPCHPPPLPGWLQRAVRLQQQPLSRNNLIRATYHTFFSDQRTHTPIQQQQHRSEYIFRWPFPFPKQSRLSHQAIPARLRTSHFHLSLKIARTSLSLRARMAIRCCASGLATGSVPFSDIKAPSGRPNSRPTRRAPHPPAPISPRACPLSFSLMRTGPKLLTISTRRVALQ
jgi:hypothetical protein